MGDKRVKVLMQGHTMGVSLLLSQLVRGPPVLPGGLLVGDERFYCGGACTNARTGDQLAPGLKGTVVAMSNLMDGKDDTRVKIRFDEHKMSMCIRLQDLTTMSH